MTRHIKVAIIIGLTGFFAEMFLIFICMGLPFGSILAAIPVGIITGRKVAQSIDLNQAVSNRLSFRAGLMSGALSSLGILAPLLLFAITAPPGATLGAELQKQINPNLIPGFLNSLPTALILGGIISALIAIGLTVGSCLFTTRYFNQRLTSLKN